MLFLLPIGHETRVQRFPYVTVGLMILNLAIFVPTYYKQMAQAEKLNEVAEKILRIDPLYFSRDREKTPREEMIEDFQKTSFVATKAKAERLRELELEYEEMRDQLVFRKYGSIPDNWSIFSAFSSIFLHGGWLHLLFNMLFLWMVGCNIEDRWGPWFFAAFYVVGGIVASGADAIARIDSVSANIGSIGASGAVAAVMGAFLLRYATTKIKFFYFLLAFIYPIRGQFKAPAYVMLPLWLLRELIFGSSDMPTGVAHWAHIGGFLFGAAGGLILWVSGLEKKYFVPRYSIEEEEHEVPEEYQRAHQLMSEGKIEEAKNLLNGVVIQYAGYLPAMLTLSKIYAKEKNRAELVKVTEAIVKKSFSTDETHFAIEAFQRMSRTFPDASLAPIVQYRLASTLTSSGLYQEAVMAYRNLAAAYPQEMLAQKSLLAAADMLADKLGMHQHAHQMYEYIVKYFPDTPVSQQARIGLNKVQALLGSGGS